MVGGSAACALQEDSGHWRARNEGELHALRTHPTVVCPMAMAHRTADGGGARTKRQQTEPPWPVMSDSAEQGRDSEGRMAASSANWGRETFRSFLKNEHHQTDERRSDVLRAAVPRRVDNTGEGWGPTSRTVSSPVAVPSPQRPFSAGSRPPRGSPGQAGWGSELHWVVSGC